MVVHLVARRSNQERAVKKLSRELRSDPTHVRKGSKETPQDRNLSRVVFEPTDGLGGGLVLSVGPCCCFVVVGSCAEASVEVADKSVAECS